MKSLLMLLVIMWVVAPVFPGQRVGPQSADEMKQMLPLTLRDFKGKRVSPDRYKGSMLLVDFWATWCAPCISEVPELNRLEAKYSASGVKVIGVTMASGEAKGVKPFIGRFKMKYTVLMGDDNQAYDLNIIGFPTTYLVTREGRIFRKYVGSSPRKFEEIEADIQKLLNGKAE